FENPPGGMAARLTGIPVETLTLSRGVARRECISKPATGRSVSTLPEELYDVLSHTLVPHLPPACETQPPDLPRQPEGQDGSARRCVVDLQQGGGGRQRLCGDSPGHAARLSPPTAASECAAHGARAPPRTLPALPALGGGAGEPHRAQHLLPGVRRPRL